MSSPRQRRSFDRVAVVLLATIGFYVVIVPFFAPGFLGWKDMESDLLRVLVGFLFLFVASGVLERNRQRARLDAVLEALNMLLYGRNFRRDREAIQILVKALRSADEKVRVKAWENLRTLTGQDFALDAEVWRSWWAVNEKRFVMKAKRPTKSGPETREDSRPE